MSGELASSLAPSSCRSSFSIVGDPITPKDVAKSNLSIRKSSLRTAYRLSNANLVVREPARHG
jgi:hypothetical protein